MATAGSTSSSAGQSAQAATPGEAYRWFLAWAVALLAVALINRSRIGHVIVYYVLALMLAFLFVTQAQWFAGALLPLSNPQKAAQEAAGPTGNAVLSGLTTAGQQAQQAPTPAQIGQQIGQSAGQIAATWG